MESSGFGPAIAYELSSLEPLNNELNLCISVSSSTNQSGLSYHKSNAWDSEDPNAYLWSKMIHWLNQKGGVEAGGEDLMKSSSLNKRQTWSTTLHVMETACGSLMTERKSPEGRPGSEGANRERAQRGPAVNSMETRDMIKLVLQWDQTGGEADWRWGDQPGHLCSAGGSSRNATEKAL